jgi:protein gp37
MADTTKIAWCRNSDGTPGATFNPWIGCTRVSAGCSGCYAEKLSIARLGVAWGNGKPRRRTAATDMGEIHCLGETASGAPIHPMARGKHRVPDDRQPLLWRSM